MQLTVSVCAQEGILADLQYWVNRFEARIAKEAQACNAEMCMEDVNHVARSIRNAAVLSILPWKVSINHVVRRVARIPDNGE